MSVRSALGISRIFNRKLLRRREANYRLVDAKRSKERQTRSLLVETLEDRRVMTYYWCPYTVNIIGDDSGGCSGSGLLSSSSNQNSSSSVLSSSSVPKSHTTNPVNAFSGVPLVSSVDLGSQGFGNLQAHSRSFAGLNNTGVNGNGWVVTNQPYLVVYNTYLGRYLVGYIESGQTSVLFGVNGDNYSSGPVEAQGRSGAKLSFDADNAEWTLIDSMGNKMVFFDLPRLNGTLIEDKNAFGSYGKIKQHVSNAGVVADYTYDANGKLQQMQRQDSVSGQVERLTYVHSTFSNNLPTPGSVELLHRVTLERGLIGGSLTAVRTVVYDYYTGDGPDAAHGRLGDLKLVTVREESGQPTDAVVTQEYYRYYKMWGEVPWSHEDYGPTGQPASAGGTDNSYPPRTYGNPPIISDRAIWSGLKLVVKDASFARMAANVSNYQSADDSALLPYVNNFYRYERWADSYWDDAVNGNGQFYNGYHFYTRYRVIEEISQGAGCTACSDGQGKFGFEVHVNQVGTGIGNANYDPNIWRVRNIEYLPDKTNADTNSDGLVDDNQWTDNDRNLIYTNELGQVLLKVLVETDKIIRSATSVSVNSGNLEVSIGSVNHGLSVGDRVAINGSRTVSIGGVSHKRPAYNGVFNVTEVVDANTFKVTLSPGSTTGISIDPATVFWTKVTTWTADYYRYRQVNPTLWYGTDYPVITPYEGYGQLVLHAHPSAIMGWDESYYGLVSSRIAPEHDNELLRNDAGQIELYTYYDTLTPTATENTAGSADKYHWQTKVKRGELDGGNILDGGTILEEKEYKKRDAGAASVYPLAKSTVYAGPGQTLPQTTTYAYTWHIGTTQVASTTVTQPVVSAVQNGSAAAESSTTVFDIYGRPTWTKDADGFINFTQYDTSTGAVIKTITDVNTALTSTFSGLPNGWTTPAADGLRPGGGLHLTTTMEVDGLGRTKKLTDPNGNVTFTLYNDANREVRVYPGWNATTGTTTGPIQVQREYWPVANAAVDQRTVYRESLTTSASPTFSGTAGNYVPTGAEAITAANLQSLSRSLTNNAGQVIAQHQYFAFTGMTYVTSQAILGTASNDSDTGNYHLTKTEYGDRGWLKRVEDATGTITRYIRDARGLVTQVWVGTDDVPSSGFWSPTNNADANMFLTTQNEYDVNGNQTKLTQYPGGNAVNRVTQMHYDWRDRQVATKSGVQTSESVNDNTSIISYTTYDNLGRALSRSSYDGDTVQIVDANSDGVPDAPAESVRRQHSANEYDNRSRLFRTTQFLVNPGDGTFSQTVGLVTAYWFDRRGNVVKQQQPGAATKKHVYDGAGRLTRSFTTDAGGDTTWADALNVTGDNVLTQSENTYDSASNLILTRQRERFHTASGTGLLEGLGSATNPSRSYFTTMYYDAANRQIATVQAGTFNGVTYSRPPQVPVRDPEEPLLITTFTYDAAGRLEDMVDPKELTTKTQYDAMGRTKRTIENYVDGSPGNSDDQIVDQRYNGASQPLSLKVVLPAGAVQETRYVYGGATARGDTLHNNRLMIETQYPNKTTGSASATEKDSYTYNAMGERITATDRNNTTHAFDFDVLGRLTSDTATILGSGIDNGIRRIGFSYNTQGLQHQITSYSDTAGATTPVNQVQRQYNGLGQLTGEYQSHSGQVQTGGGTPTPQVQYNYSTPSATSNHSRASGIVYPNGRAISYNYTSAVDNAISRLTSISDSSATLENYHYLGQSTVVRRAHAQPGVDLSYIKVIGEADGDAGDIYTGLDRFGRVVDQRWRTSAADVDRFQYTYDQNGNRLSRANTFDSALNELYTYDDMNRLTSTQRGTMDARIVGSYFFHKGSFFDQSGGGTYVQTALDTGKALAREQVGALTLTYQNLINTTRGINGLVFDIQDLGSTNLTATDFQFQMSPQFLFNEQNNPPSGWGAAPTPTIQVVAASGSTPARVILRWSDNAIANRWLRVTLKSNANTGLFKDESFYAGHLRGETTGVANGVFTVSYAQDRAPIQAAMGTNAGVNSTVDIDKSGLVQMADIVAIQSNVGNQLPAIGLAANPLADLTRSQSWTLDAQGNWTGLSNNGGTAQSRTHNSQNQVTQVGSATLSFDAAGNMTTDEQGRTLKYDAWNRLVKVEQNGNVVSQYQYDGLKRRITEQQATGPQRVLYYSANWQVVEERESGVVQAQQVWSPVYVDALILRDRNANGISGDGPGGSGLEQRHYVAQDANFNVTALIDAATGAIAERYYYQAYGLPVVLDANFVPRATGQSLFAWRYLHQGGRFDWAAGYYHFRNRDLSPTLGRWLNLDPIGFEGSKWNLYEYVEGRPTVEMDPKGLCILWPYIDGRFRTEAERRRGHGPFGDSAQHCWAACYVSICSGGALGQFAALSEDLQELGPGGDWPDVMWNHLGGLANPLPFPNPGLCFFPARICDAYCQTYP